MDGTDPGEVQATTRGDGLENLPLTPYTDRIAEYTSRALDALESATVPSGARDVVRDYFTQLEP